MPCSVPVQQWSVIFHDLGVLWNRQLYNSETALWQQQRVTVWTNTTRLASRYQPTVCGIGCSGCLVNNMINQTRSTMACYVRMTEAVWEDPDITWHTMSPWVFGPCLLHNPFPLLFCRVRNFGDIAPLLPASPARPLVKSVHLIIPHKAVLLTLTAH